MNSSKLRIWVGMIMLLACGIVYTSAMSLLPVANAADPVLT